MNSYKQRPIVLTLGPIAPKDTNKCHLCVELSRLHYCSLSIDAVNGLHFKYNLQGVFMNSVQDNKMNQKLNQSDRPDYSKNEKTDAQHAPFNDQKQSSFKDDATGKNSDADKKEGISNKKGQSEVRNKSDIESND